MLKNFFLNSKTTPSESGECSHCSLKAGTTETLGKSMFGGMNVTGSGFKMEQSSDPSSGNISSLISGFGDVFSHGIYMGTEIGQMQNPTRILLENSLTTLEDSKFAITFPSGTSALTACAFLCESGNHIVVSGIK